MSLSNLSVRSDAAMHALEKQLKSSEKYYLNIFSKFVIGATDNEVMRKEAMSHAVSSFGGEPDAHSTIVSIEVLNGELGAIVRNATIFAIAATTTFYIKGTRLFGGGVVKFRNAAGERPLSPTMSWPAYVKFMEANHPDATNIAREIGIGANKKTKENVIAVMGYLIDQAIINDQIRINKYK